MAFIEDIIDHKGEPVPRDIFLRYLFIFRERGRERERERNIDVQEIHRLVASRGTS